MTLYPTLTCTSRTSIGSNAVRKLLQQGLLPATIYGHGAPASLVMEQRDFIIACRTGHSGSQIMRLTVDGQDGGLALVKNVQRHVTKYTPVHLDLQRISLQEKLHITVSIVLEGEAAGVALGGVLEMNTHALNLRCAATAVPESITHDISDLQVGGTLLAGQLVLPEGCELLDRADELVAVIRMKAE
ncbi:MAG: 50S ribosomal protein L25 [Armatimonadota bacterium]